MNFLKQLFCKHTYSHHSNLFIALTDDWPCVAQHVEKCSKCGKEKIVSRVIGGGK